MNKEDVEYYLYEYTSLYHFKICALNSLIYNEDTCGICVFMDSNNVDCSCDNNILSIIC